MINPEISKDLQNAPEYREALRSFKDNSWNEGEEKTITFTSFTEEDLQLFTHAIHYFFNDPAVQQTLEKFVPLGDSHSQLAADAAASDKARQLATQQEDLTRQLSSAESNLKKLNNERSGLQAELRAQQQLYDAGTQDGKKVVQPKIDSLQQQINSL